MAYPSSRIVSYEKREVWIRKGLLLLKELNCEVFPELCQTILTSIEERQCVDWLEELITNEYRCCFLKGLNEESEEVAFEGLKYVCKKWVEKTSPSPNIIIKLNKELEHIETCLNLESISYGGGQYFIRQDRGFGKWSKIKPTLLNIQKYVCNDSK